MAVGAESAVEDALTKPPPSLQPLPAAHDGCQLSNIIRDAKAQGIRRQRRIQYSVIAVSTIIILTVFALFITSVVRERVGRAKAPSAVFAVFAILPSLCSELLLVSLTHTQPRWSRVVCCLVSALHALVLVIKVFREADVYADIGVKLSAQTCGALVGAECRAALILYVAMTFVNSASVAITSIRIIRLTCASALSHVVVEAAWRCMAQMCALIGASNLVCFITLSCWLRTFDRDISQHLVKLNFPAFFLLAAFASSRRLQRSLQARLAIVGGEVSSAVSIGSMLGVLDADAVLSTAPRTFRAVPAAAILLNWPHPQTGPDPSFLAQLGSPDAFISHSWWDDATLRQGALRAWCAEFQRRNHRDPKLWVDNFCLDQDNVAVSLACMPLYIAGCQRFVVLRGPTTLNRLWCIVEIFTFLAMGGSPDAIEVVSFEGAPSLYGIQTTSPGEPLVDVMSNCDDGLFDARRATCATRDDQLLLTAVVEAYPRGIHAFNAELLAALRDGEERWQKSLEQSADTSTEHVMSRGERAGGERAGGERAGGAVAGPLARMRNFSGGLWGTTAGPAPRHKAARSRISPIFPVGRQATARVAPQLPPQLPMSPSDSRRSSTGRTGPTNS